MEPRKGSGLVTKEALKKANELTEKIEELEDFMFWCSGRREGFRRYPAAVVKVKRSWCGSIESREYKMPERLQEKVTQCIEEELDLLKAERDSL